MREIYLPGGKVHEVKPPEELRDRILKEKKPRCLDELADQIGTGVEIVADCIDQLKEEGYGIGREGETVFRTNTPKEGVFFDLSDLDRHLKFGVVSDSHLSSKKERLEELRELYGVFKSEGVNHVFHTGDITDGWGVYRGQEFEVKHFGQEEQIDYAVKNYPQEEGITTEFITGNHDLRQYERGGVDPGVAIGRRRKDMTYLGQAYATVLLPNGATMELIHPDGGVAYALSYRAQRQINNLSPKDIPSMLVYGHFHTSFYMYYRNIHFLQAPCTKDAGIYEKRKGINPTIGGWLVEATISTNGEVNRFRPELMSF